MTVDVKRVRVFRDPEDENNARKQIAAGAMLPSGTIVVEWDREAFPADEQTQFPVESRYRTVEDAQEGTGGRIIFVDEAAQADVEEAIPEVDPDK